MLQAYSWPGNIRELKNLVERLSVLYAGHDILPEYLPAEVLADQATAKSYDDAEPELPLSDDISAQLASEEKRIILGALRESGGHKGNAAKLLNISRHALKRRLQKLGIEA